MQLLFPDAIPRKVEKSGHTKKFGHFQISVHRFIAAGSYSTEFTVYRLLSSLKEREESVISSI